MLYFAASAWLLADEPEQALTIFERLTGNELNAGPAVQKPMDARPAEPEVWYLKYQDG